MYILGIYEGHNSTAALLKDGKIIGCVSEERFSGKKNNIGFPHKSIKYLLEQEKIKGKDLDMVVTPGIWGVPVFVESEVRKDKYLRIATILYAPYLFVRKITNFLEYYFPPIHFLQRFLYDFAFKTVGNKTTKKQKKFIAGYFGIEENKVEAFEHHMAHGAVAYYGSPYIGQDALVLTIDGEGDLLSATVNVVKNGQWQRLAETSSDSSLGWIYMEVTGYLGMKMNEHEYKVMGLAPYAKEYGVKPVYDLIKDIIKLDSQNPLRFKSKFDTHLTGYFLRKKMAGKRFDYIAGAFQKLVEDRITEWVTNAIKKTGIKTLCMGGGVVMNVKANLKISELPEVEKFFPCPSSGDESTPIGACYLGYLEFCKKNKMKPAINSLKNLYLGPFFTNKEIIEFLKKGKYDKKYKVEYIEDIEKKIAKLLSENKIVARIAGKMEWGARALGNRSILANPSNLDNVRVINEQMKMRDFWMPFTPSILKERMKDYVINPKDIPSSYMVITFHSTFLAQKHLRAAMHPYDFTVRPQSVDKSWNPRYHKLLSEFEKLTGIGGVLNTSFNLHGLPVVMGPKEAMHAFENSGLKFLAMENYLVSKIHE
ncbi:MAG: carbamoyltransferase C-terminal domain-containing protein [Candidatus Levybacteria bacterium]|nr:carbamoyltransferase C-terminal domain-containing protein [Candidatus Levybacteria bacterium]